MLDKEKIINRIQEVLDQYEKMPIIKVYGTDFNSEYGALTLSPDCIGFHSENGWTVTGEILEDYYSWVNDFSAEHDIWGRVWGNFENEVNADSEEGFQDFIKHFPPEAWDYGDI